jgi:iron complex transport system ATP-binding protein
MKLDIKEATFFYDRKAGNVFENVSFCLKEGDIFCILGPNGCGKTTLLKCINNLLKLKGGSILLDGTDIRLLDKTEVAKQIGYVPQTHNPTFPFSVLDVVLMGRAPHLGLLSSPTKRDVKIAEDAIETLGISHLISKPYTEISGGERRLVLLSRVLAQQPAILLLDEPTSQLDYGNQIHILEIIEKLGSTGLSIFMTSHFPDHALLIASKVAIMNEGGFTDMGEPNEVVTEENLESAYGIKVKVVCVDSDTNRKVCVPLKKGLPQPPLLT